MDAVLWYMFGGGLHSLTLHNPSPISLATTLLLGVRLELSLEEKRLALGDRTLRLLALVLVARG